MIPNGPKFSARPGSRPIFQLCTKKGVKCTGCILKDTQKVRVCELRNYLRKLGRFGSLNNEQTFINTDNANTWST